MSSPPLSGIVHFFDGAKENEMIWDDTYFPIMTLLTNGVPNMELMKKAYAYRDPLIEYAKANGLHTMLISDLTLLKTPDAVTRRAISELAKDEDTFAKDVMLGTAFIVTNPLMRGIVTAISWVAGDAMVPSVYVADIRGAIKEIEKLYRKVGKEMPEFPVSYTFDKPAMSR